MSHPSQGRNRFNPDFQIGPVELPGEQQHLRIRLPATEHESGRMPGLNLSSRHPFGRYIGHAPRHLPSGEEGMCGYPPLQVGGCFGNRPWHDRTGLRGASSPAPAKAAAA